MSSPGQLSTKKTAIEKTQAKIILTCAFKAWMGLVPGM